MAKLEIENESTWESAARQWRLREGTIYLNHGSFGPSPESVLDARREWLDRLESQPMDFYVRTMEPALLDARQQLADFVGTARDNLVFVDNATFAMNILADSFPLRPGDEVLLTDHEYEAVNRIWQRACQRAVSDAPRVVDLPLPLESQGDIADRIFAQVNERTRLIVVSQVTSATSVILPIDDICQRARELNVMVCVDGPHSLAQLPLSIDELGCDFFTASCHKWLCAPFGTGFLHVHPRHHDLIQPQVLSFGRLPPHPPETWDEEFTWNGTRDPTAYLAVPSAIDFMNNIGLDTFRKRSHDLAQDARQQLVERVGARPITPDSDEWYGSMVSVELPACDGVALYDKLSKRHGIEVLLCEFSGKILLRVSCHLYNCREHIDRLVEAIRDS